MSEENAPTARFEGKAVRAPVCHQDGNPMVFPTQFGLCQDPAPRPREFKASFRWRKVPFSEPQQISLKFTGGEPKRVGPGTRGLRAVCLVGKGGQPWGVT